MTSHYRLSPRRHQIVIPGLARAILPFAPVIAMNTQCVGDNVKYDRRCTPESSEELDTTYY